MTAAEKRAVEKVVGERLKDPYSARFKHPVFDMPKGSGGTIYCGYVNSKNSYGGYAGDALFMVGFFTEVVKGKPVTTAKLIEMGLSDPDDAESEVMRQACRDKPVP